MARPFALRNPTPMPGWGLSFGIMVTMLSVVVLSSTVVPVDIPVSASPFHKVADYTGLSDAAAVAAAGRAAPLVAAIVGAASGFLKRENIIYPPSPER